MTRDLALRRLLGGRRVAVLCLNFGPYHIARLRAIAQALAPFDARLVGLELAAVETQYPWRVAREREPFEWRTLVADRPVEAVTPSEQRRRTRQALDALDPAAVVIPGWSHAFLRAAAAWARRRGAVSVVASDSAAGTRRSGATVVQRKWLLELYKRWLLRGFDAGVAAGNASRDYLVGLGMRPERVLLKYDVVDNAFFARLADETRAGADRYRAQLTVPRRFFLYPSRMQERKNHLGLLDAYARYLKRAGGDAWALVLVGSGETQRAVDRRVAEIGSPLIVRRDFAQAEDLARYYGLASALVFPSWAETWGLIVNEAAAAGLPVLVSNACPVVEHLVVEGENGWSFDPLNANQLADLLARVAALPEEELARLGAASRRIVSEWGVDDHAASVLAAIALGAENRKG